MHVLYGYLHVSHLVDFYGRCRGSKPFIDARGIQHKRVVHVGSCSLNKKVRVTISYIPYMKTYGFYQVHWMTTPFKPCVFWSHHWQLVEVMDLLSQSNGWERLGWERRYPSGNESLLPKENHRFKRAFKRGGPVIVPWRAVWLELGLGPWDLLMDWWHCCCSDFFFFRLLFSSESDLLQQCILREKGSQSLRWLAWVANASWNWM